MASPVSFGVEDPQGRYFCFIYGLRKLILSTELIRPALHGTTSVLHSASQPGSSVQRAIVVSSLAAIVDTDAPTPVVFSEESWNDRDVAEVREKGAAAAQAPKYRASKTLAERAAWDFWNGHKKEVGWDLVVLNPPLVLGPFLHEVDKPEDLNESVRMFYNSVVKGAMDNNTLANAGYVSCYLLLVRLRGLVLTGGVRV